MVVKMKSESTSWRLGLKLSVAFAMIVLLVVGFFVMRTDQVSKFISPKKYWINEIKKFESDIRTYDWLVQDSQLEMVKRQRVGEVDIAKEKLFAERFGMNVKDALDLAVDEVNQDLEKLNTEIESRKEILEEKRKLLQDANLEFAKLG